MIEDIADIDKEFCTEHHIELEPRQHMTECGLEWDLWCPECEREWYDDMADLVIHKSVH